MTYTISNKFITASIKDFGAELCSLKTKNNDIEYIWQGDENYWNRHAPILFPIVGKLIDNEYIYDDKTYKLNQHGFARDSLFEVIKKDEEYICFKLEDSKESLEVYPFSFSLYIGYSLIESSLEISYKVVNKSNKDMFFSIGAHPAFNWPLENTNKEECFLEFEDTLSLERLFLSSEGIRDEKDIITLENNKLLLNEEIFSKDALVIENLKNKTVTLKNTSDDRNIKVDFSGFPYLGIWSKPTGAPFICIEPWYGLADEKKHNKRFVDKKGILTLKDTEEFSSSYRISV